MKERKASPLFPKKTIDYFFILHYLLYKNGLQIENYFFGFEIN